MCNSGYFFSFVDGLGTLSARSFLASTHARFHKELDKEMSNTMNFYKTWFAVYESLVRRSCPVYIKQQMQLCFCPGRL